MSIYSTPGRRPLSRMSCQMQRSWLSWSAACVMISTIEAPTTHFKPSEWPRPSVRPGVCRTGIFEVTESFYRSVSPAGQAPPWLCSTGRLPPWSTTTSTTRSWYCRVRSDHEVKYHNVLLAYDLLIILLENSEEPKHRQSSVLYVFKVVWLICSNRSKITSKYLQ